MDRTLDELHLLTPLRILAIIVVAIVVAIVLRSIVIPSAEPNPWAFRVPTASAPTRGSGHCRRRCARRSSASSGRTAVITIIGELGVNIGGVIATATVIGGAIAFGAQTLIRDVIAGLFVLAEDQYGVGDSVDLGYATGEVERITLRSVRLRDTEGKVWHVAHGNVALRRQPVEDVGRPARARASHATAISVWSTRSSAASCEQLRDHPAVGPTLIGEPSRSSESTEVRDDRLVYRVTAPTHARQARRGPSGVAQARVGSVPRGRAACRRPDPPTVTHIVSVRSRVLRRVVGRQRLTRLSR